MELKEILAKHQFNFKKSLGQNFVSDSSLLKAIAADAGVTAEDTVVEIGTGAGTLTRVLAESAARVYSFDVDNALAPILAETLSGLDDKVTVTFADVLKTSDEELAKITGTTFKVVANIPYYITTPLIMRFVESSLDVRSITVMVQDEVAQRLVAQANTPEYGAISAAIALNGTAKITRSVNRRLFHPMPKVDSAVVHINLNKAQYEVKDRAFLVKLIRAGFQMRRKTLVNNISASLGIDKETARNTLATLGYSESVRGEALSVTDYIRIAELLHP